MHTLHIDGVDADIHVVHLVGTEALSEPFAFDVTFVLADGSVAFADITGQKALLTLRSGADPRFVHGVVVRLELASPTKSRATYRVTIQPSMHATRLNRASRIFQDMDVPSIAKKVFAAGGVPAAGYRFALKKSYTPRTYCVQYAESDWDFVQRLFEQEGAHTYFEHSEGGDVLVIADSPSAHAPIPGESSVPFRPQSGALRSLDHVSSFVVADSVRAGTSTVRDYDFKRPTMLLEGKAAGSADAAIEVYEHPGGFTNPGDATPVATRRLDELRGAQRVVRGGGSLARFSPGATFTLADHPADGLDGPWLLTRVEHRGSEADMEGAAGQVRYENDFEAIPAGAAFGPPRLTRKPIVAGVQTAVVVGPSGEEIHVDSFGRIRVMFHWDRAAASDSNTCWIRVAQPWAGPSYGAMFIPRVGHEVVVSFEEGDPDRPLVTGSVYHGANVVPYALPGDKTKSTIKSNSSPGGAGFNELRFEDRAGSEEIYLHAQKDLNAETLHDESRTVGHDASLTVTNNRSRTVGVDETIAIGANETVTIGADLSVAVTGAAMLAVGGDLATTVNGAASTQISKSLTQVVGEAMTLNVDGDASTAIGKGATEDVKGAKSISVGDAFSLAVQKDSAIAVDGSSTEDIGKDKTVTVGSTFTMTCGDAKVTVKKNGDIEITGKGLTIKASGPIKVSGQKLEVSSDGAVKVNASGSVKISGSSVDVN